jgi:hypothetical protein
VLAETEESRQNFADAALKFVIFYGFDGVRKGREKKKFFHRNNETVNGTFLSSFTD